MAIGQVGLDGGRPGVDTELDELFAQTDDLLLPQVGDPGRRRLRTCGAQLESGLAFPSVAGQAFVEPAAVHPVGLRQLTDGLAGAQVCLDQEATLVHRRPSSAGVSYVLTQVSLKS